MLVLLSIFLGGRYYQLETRGVNILGVKVFFYSLNMWDFLWLVTLLGSLVPVARAAVANLIRGLGWSTVHPGSYPAILSVSATTFVD
jgi:hypothetical protein